MWIHILIFLIYCVLFFLSKGFFSKTGAFLAGKVPDFLQLTKKQMRLCLLVIFCGNLLGSVISFMSYLESNTIREGYLIRKEQGEGSYEEELVVSDGTLTQKMQIVVAEVPYTEKEIKQILDEAVASMDERILGENETFDRIEYALNLVTQIENTPVTIEWNTDQPVYLDWEGTIGEEVPKEGVAVHLTGELSAGEYLRIYEKELMVYPEKRSEEEVFVRELEEQLRTSANAGGRYQKLPQEVDGKKITWTKLYAREGWLVTGIAVLTGVFLIFRQKSQEKEKQQQKEKEMLLDYPLILNKLILFMRAGVSSRMAVQRVVAEYQRGKRANVNEKKKQGNTRAAYEELSRMYFEMEQGISEEDAYERFGNRCGLVEYRTLATLLIQNLKKGSHQFLPSLEKECKNAFEERKRRALIAGEEAGTKLLIPMLIMLVIVLMMIMVPSFSAL